MIFAPLDRDLLLIDPRSGPQVEASLNALSLHLAADKIGQRILAGGVSGDGNDDDFWSNEEDSFLSYVRPYKVQGGTLSIPVRGVLLANFPYQFGGLATGYGYIERAFKRGMNDPAVARIALTIDSPGGMVSGCFDCVDAMTGEGNKPVRAFASDSAYSAAYAIATAADKIIVTRTGGVGSIGVVTTHVDYSDALKKEGIKVTFISAPKGGYKTEGNSYEPLSDEAEARIQARIDELYGEFVSTVANNRGMSAEAVRGTQALCYGAAQSIEVGLADGISRLDKGLAEFAAETPTTGVFSMAKNFTQEEHDADMNLATTAATAAGVTAGGKAERARIVAILGCAEAATRPIAAHGCALETSMTADEAVAFLKKIPEEKAVVVPPTAEEARSAAFQAVMDQNNPNLHQTGSGADDKASPSDRILRNYANAGGRVIEARSH